MFANEYVRYVMAKREFQISNEFEFIEFDDVTADGVSEIKPAPDQVEMFAAVKLGYKGEVPDSYKTLNIMIGDWVEEHVDSLTREIHKALKNHFEEYYPNSDTSSLDEEGETSIWLEQLDYMPRIDPSDHSIIIEIELSLDTELAED